MMSLALQLAGYAANAAYSSSEGSGPPVKIGFIVLTIIMLPVVSLVAASLLGHPRTYRVPALFMGMVTLLMGSMVASFLVIGAVLKLVVPQ